LAKDAVGLRGGEPLVHVVKREAGPLRHSLGEVAGLPNLLPLGPIHVQGEADHEGPGAGSIGEAGEVLRIRV